MVRLFPTIVELFQLRAWKGWLQGTMHVYLLTTFYLILVNNVFDYESLFSIVALILSLALYLSYLYLINDITDLSYDRIAGRKVTSLPKPILLLVLLLIFILNYSIAILLLKQFLFIVIFAIAYLLNVFYSAPPIRFKGRGALGVLCNSLLEKVVPVLSVFTFFNYFNFETLLFLIFSFILHLMIMMHHQVGDFEGDLKAKVSTFAVKYGRERTLRISFKYFHPMFSVLFVLLFLLFAVRIPFFIYLIPVLIIGYFLTKQLVQRGLYIREDKILPWPHHLVYADVCLRSVIPIYFAFLISVRFPPYIILLVITIGSQYYLMVNQYRRLLNVVSNAIAVYK